MLYVDSLFPRPNDWDNLQLFYFFYFYISDCSKCFQAQVINCFLLLFFGSSNISFIVLFNNSKKWIIMNGKLKKVHAFYFSCLYIL